MTNTCECCEYWAPTPGSRLCDECARDFDRVDVNERAARGMYDVADEQYEAVPS